MKHAAIGASLVLMMSSVHARDTAKEPLEEAERRLAKSRKVDVLGANIFGDQVSNSNGALSFSVTDVSLPNVKETHLNTASNGQQYPSKPEVRPARPEGIPGG
ncbi:hypothetical protein K4043_08635 [Stenotrophomonas sp. SRS1]|uniref:hypothetical protein n=1 Tax=Stenotrophomonas sp. SRS1 TaxID=2870345 RepID=UPI002236FAA2|nr:hypothetical protein [Stenotrophomonas sp. SRS1]MCW6028080.1 hypothetical protein [Stenotrophomonas sp. SRS1]